MKLETEFQQQQGIAVQANGALVAFHGLNDEIAFASANCHSLLGLSGEVSILGTHIRDVLGREVFHALRNVKMLPSIAKRREHIGKHTINGQALDISAFQSGSFVVAEITPADVDPMPSAYDVLKDVLLIQDRVQASNDDGEIFRNIVTLLRTISGYDCVAACKYEEAHSQVVASAGKALSAHETFEVNTQIHVIQDIGRGTVIVRTASDVDQFDLSLSALRCPPGPSIEKLRRLGAAACVTQGIQIGHHLWGYLVFLHRSPRAPNHRTRLALSHLQPLISARLNSF